MAASPAWKVYDADGNYQGAVKEPEAAGALVAFYGERASIRCGHARRDSVWIEGTSGQAAESYDAVAEKCREGKAHVAQLFRR